MQTVNPVFVFLALLFCPCIIKPLLFFSSPLLFMILKFVFHMLAFINLFCMLLLQLQIYFIIIKDNVMSLCSNTMP